MVIARTSMSIAALALCVSLVACSSVEAPRAAEATSSSSATPTPDPSTSGAAPASAAPLTGPEPSPTSGLTDPDQPVAKIERAGKPSEPSVTADPVGTSEAVSYDDGVSVRIDDVTAGRETAQGPGSFPDREYVRLEITIDNGSSDAIDLGTSVLTVLDASGGAAVRVYAAEADVTDFAGTLAAGDSATAAYAFAIPDDARDQVTVVVDFDGDHSSAVLRGGLD